MKTPMAEKRSLGFLCYRRLQRQSRTSMKLYSLLIGLFSVTLLVASGLRYRRERQWQKNGCPLKILRHTANMQAALEVSLQSKQCLPACVTRASRRKYCGKVQDAKQLGLLDSQLGSPTQRRPKTAIVNFVSFHVEVLSSLAFHFVKLHHNVSVFAREDFGMEGVMAPFYRKHFKRIEMFFYRFYEFDTIVWTTFPTCHLNTYREVLRFGLPQRHIVLVHNPDQLNDTAVATSIADGDARMLSIAPHVGNFALKVLAEHGVHPQQDWIAPIMPVVFPEECGQLDWAWKVHACNRGAVAGTAPGADALSPPAPQLQLLPPGQRGICVQGKLDPSRRDYYSLFQEVRAHADTLAAANFSLVLVGRGDLDVPQDLLGAGLVRQYVDLPFQEFYEVLHSCVALLPAFNSPAYYRTKGSSTVGASLTAGTPLIASRQLLGAYTFLEESGVFLVEDDASDLQAMLHVLEQDPLSVEAKRLGLERMRRDLYDRNLEVLQRMLGKALLWKQLYLQPQASESYHQSWRIDEQALRVPSPPRS